MKVIDRIQNIFSENNQSNNNITFNRFKNHTYQISTREKLEKLFEYQTIRIINIFFSIYILFAEDIKILSSHKSSDIYFSIITIIIIIFYLFEIVVQSYIQDEYFSSLFCFIDFLGLGSLMLDIHWITDLFSQSFFTTSMKGYTNKMQGIVRMTRIVRLSTRIIRLVRIIRILKLLKIFKYSKNQDLVEQSKVGKQLEDQTIKRLLILILLIMLATVFLSTYFYYHDKTYMEFGLLMFNQFNETSIYNNLLFNLTFNMYVVENQKTSIPLIYARVFNTTYGNFNTEDLRPIELFHIYEKCVSTDDYDKYYNTCEALFDNRKTIKHNCMINIINTLVISIILGLGVISFNQDMNKLVIEPIEKMIIKIKELSKNPIRACIDRNKDTKEDIQLKKFQNFCCNYSENPIETVMLERGLEKISSLLAQAFGETGAEIISKNIQNKLDIEIDPNIPGKRIIGIYGYCKIRNIKEISDVLEEDVIILVNEIAQIVHNTTTENGGVANMNTGEAFLIVWKFDEKIIEFENNHIKLKESQLIKKTTDMALISFIKIIINVHKSKLLKKYKQNKKLKEKINDFNGINLGLCLNLGSSIEGIVGSLCKIDVSYLSPNVTMTSNLGDKSKEYDISLLLTGSFYNNLSDSAKQYIRQLDCISYDNSELINLYTCDINVSNINLNSTQKIEEKNNRKLKDDNIDYWKEFVDKDLDFIDSRKKFTENFYNLYYSGFNHYINGQWLLAQNYFEKINNTIFIDTPTISLLKFMQSYDFVAPSDWKGYRIIYNYHN